MNDAARLHQLMAEQLDLMVAIVGLGAVGLVVLLGSGLKRYVFSALIGMLGALMFATQFAVSKLAGSTMLFDLAVLAGGGVAGAAATGFISSAIHLYKGKDYQQFMTGMRSHLEPLLWLDETARKSATVAGAEAVAQRWFVAVAAATGSIVASLVMFPKFTDALHETFGARGLLAAVVLTMVSFVLVGPVHDFVLERSVTSSEGNRLAPHQALSTLCKELSWRSSLRLALVGLALLTMELAYDCLGQAIAAPTSGATDTSAINATFTILLAGITPGVVSYYWSAALQLGGGAQMLRKKAVDAATACTSVLYFPFGIMIALLLAAASVNAQADRETNYLPIILLFVSPLIGAGIAYVFAALTTGLPALAGARVLERMKGWPAMAWLLAAVAIATAIPTLLVLTIYQVFLDTSQWSMVIDTLVAALGWMIGLLASGFPKLVTNARPLQGAEAGAESQPGA